jgi:hypothetical protein
MFRVLPDSLQLHVLLRIVRARTHSVLRDKTSETEPTKYHNGTAT